MLEAVLIHFKIPFFGRLPKPLDFIQTSLNQMRFMTNLCREYLNHPLFDQVRGQTFFHKNRYEDFPVIPVFESAEDSLL